MVADGAPVVLRRKQDQAQALQSRPGRSPQGKPGTGHFAQS